MIRLLRTRRFHQLAGWPIGALALALLLALAWWAYHPGLAGAFLFDDLGTLPKLGATGPVDHWSTFWRYITSGSADPTGRPLALLSFLVDAHNWPANPYPFKVTNVILHLINGALLAWVLWKLGRVLARTTGVPLSEKQCHPVVIPGLPAGQNPESVRSAIDGHSNSETDSESPLRGIRNDELGDGRDAVGGDALRGVRNDDRSASPLDNRAIAIAALFGAGAWLLHPLFVSATLYIVQREAMLPATFELIGLLGWMASREALARGHVKRALVGMALSAWLCTGLAVQSKANGALFPVLLLLTEWIVLSRRPMPTPTLARAHKRAVSVFLIVPSALVLGYLLSLLPHSLTAPVEARGWSIGQRLLTEPRVLADYLRLLFIPHAHSTGLFNDQFAVSTSWMHPASTIPCIVLIVALIGSGFSLRKRHPAIALALLFYFTAQLMESGWIPLELYFEHRNYVPALLLFWPIGLALAKPGALRFLRVGVAVLILAVLAMLTLQRATLWGDAPRQAATWAAMNPDSSRAQTSAALYKLQTGQPRIAAARLRMALPRHPDDLQIPVNLVTAECQLGTVDPTTLDAATTALSLDRVGGAVAFSWFSKTLPLAAANQCKGLSVTDMQQLLNAARQNPYWHTHAGLRANLFHLQGEVALVEHHPQRALLQFNRALRELRQPETALAQATELAEAGYPRLGLDHLNLLGALPPPRKPGFGMARIHTWVLHRQHYWSRQVEYIRGILLAQTSRDRGAISTQ